MGKGVNRVHHPLNPSHRDIWSTNFNHDKSRDLSPVSSTSPGHRAYRPPASSDHHPSVRPMLSIPHLKPPIVHAQKEKGDCRPEQPHESISPLPAASPRLVFAIARCARPSAEPR